jgi:hypothetical protein
VSRSRRQQTTAQPGVRKAGQRYLRQRVPRRGTFEFTPGDAISFRTALVNSSHTILSEGDVETATWQAAAFPKQRVGGCQQELL